jgi:integrase
VVGGGEHERQSGIDHNVVCSRITDSDPDRIPRGRAEILDDAFCSADPIDAIPVAHGADYREIRAFRAECKEITFCGLDDEHGADISVVARQLGHSDIKTTARYYLRPDLSVLKSLQRAWERLIIGVA